jgi:Receptor family ligand binding region
MKQKNNGHILWVFFFLLIAGACSLFKESAQKPKPGPKGDSDSSVVQIDTPLIDTTPFKGEKDRYNIAILLPFSIDRNIMNRFDMEFRKTPYRPLFASETYEGILLALDELKKQGFKANVFVYDTENDFKTIESILEKKELKKADLIIGPIFPTKLKKVSEFSRKHKIPLVSPISSKAILDKPNPYFINATPGAIAHSLGLADFVSEKYSRNHILIAHRDEKDETELAGIIENRLKSNLTQFNETLPYTDLTIDKNGEIEPLEFLENDTNIVIVTSFNEIFAVNIMREIEELIEDKPVVLFGMYTWLDRFKSIRFDQLATLNYHYTVSRYHDINSVLYDSIRTKYKEEYGFPPSNNVLKGYNIMAGFGYLLQQYGYGKDMINNLDKINNTSLTETFLFAPVLSNKADDTGGINHIENMHVDIFRYKNYKMGLQNH